MRRRYAGAATLSAAAVLALCAGAAAQTPQQDDLVCRQYADQQTAPLRAQASGQAVGSTLLGAGLGAAVGAVIGGGRGAGIGAASGAVLGTGAGVANAQNAEAYIQQQYNAYYSQCMASRAAAAAPPAGYPPQAGYAVPPPPGYAPATGAAVPPPPGQAESASDLNRAELERSEPAPAYPPYPGSPPPRY